LASHADDEKTVRREIDLSLALARECGDTWAEEAALAVSEALGDSANGARNREL